MVIKIKGISISVPNFIAEWVKKDKDNETEFNGMLDAIMYAVKTYYREKYTPNPYQQMYEKQLNYLIEKGLSREQANYIIKETIGRCFREYPEFFDYSGVEKL